MNYRAFFLLVWTTVLSVFTYAQKPITTSEILGTAKNQYLLQLEQQRLDFLKKNNPKLPFMDELEVRTETNDLNIRQQRFTLRGRFHTKEQREAQANWNQAKIELQSIEEKIILNDLLYSRYVGILEALYFEQLLDAKNEEKILLEDKLTVLKKSINLPRFDVLDFIDAEEDFQKAERDILRLENELNLSQAKIERWVGMASILQKENSNLVGIEKVMEIVRAMSVEPSEAHATLVKRNLNVQLAAREQAIRQAREDNTFEFFQARIGGSDNRGLRENFRLGLGFRIPVRNREELDLIELEFEKLDEKIRYDELRYKLKKRMTSVRLRMENNFRIYQLLKLQIENSQSDEVLEQYQKIAGASPFAMLKLKGIKFNKELELFQIEQDIYLDYIEMLDASGIMMELPLRNYLDADLVIIP